MDLLSLIFPHSCVHCGKLGLFICANCYAKLEFIKLPIRLKLDHNYVDKVWSACVFKPPISELIYQFKYQNVRDIAEYAGKLLYLTQIIPPVDLVTSVPLTKKRYDERGFNQAQVIAQTFVHFSQLKYQDTLIRTKHVPTQASLHNRLQRLHNLDQVFAIHHQVNQEDLKGKSVLIIDDVLTTGTTLNQSAKVLKLAGAAHVFGLTLAHGS